MLCTCIVATISVKQGGWGRIGSIAGWLARCAIISAAAIFYGIIMLLKIVVNFYNKKLK